MNKRAEICRLPGIKPWTVDIYDAPADQGVPIAKRQVGASWQTFETWQEAYDWALGQVAPVKTWQHASRGLIHGRAVKEYGGGTVIQLAGDHPHLAAGPNALQSTRNGERLWLITRNLTEVRAA